MENNIANFILNENISSGEALYINNADVTLEKHSYIAGGYQAVFLFNNDISSHSLNVIYSYIEGRNVNYETNGDGVITTLLSANDYNINFFNSYLYSYGGPVVVVKDANYSLTMTLENTIVQRSIDNNSSSPAIRIDGINGSVSVTADSSSYFCNMVSDVGAMFDTIYAGTNITFDVTTMSNHSANDNIPLCESIGQTIGETVEQP